jgi:glycosyltransferase involved in cell wall biosynthesis
MKVAIVTPTIGTTYLSKCLESVDNQTYENLTHYVFMDGIQHWKEIDDIVEGADKVRVVKFEENVGKGWYGHRVYAACSFLVNADIICYLDEDNWIEPNHVESLVNTIKQGNDWAFSLRKIYDKEGNYLCEDNCESLGKWPVFFDENVHHIDTSSFAVKRDVAVRIGHSWYGQWGADRQFFHNLSKNYPCFDCSREHSLCYRLDGNPNSVKREFFDQGNLVMSNRYNGAYPWKIKEERLWSPGSPVTLVLT